MCEWKTAETWFLAKLFINQSSIVSRILDFIHWMVTIFRFDHMTGENRELDVHVLKSQDFIVMHLINSNWQALFMEKNGSLYVCKLHELSNLSYF